MPYADAPAQRPAALTQAVLDQTGCGTPGCACNPAELYLTAFCHPRAGLTVKYAKATGVLDVRCKQCRAQVGEVRVAAT